MTRKFRGNFIFEVEMYAEDENQARQELRSVEIKLNKFEPTSFDLESMQEINEDGEDINE